jgi:hypothetical protein
MCETRTPTRSETINTWVKTVAIIAAGVWAVWTFNFKEVRAPKNAPVNITLTLQLKKGGLNVDKNLVAVEMQITATNPSSRRIYLLPSAWHVRGLKLNPRDAEEMESFSKHAIAKLSQRGALERYSTLEDSMILAAGTLFSDEGLNPGETVSRTIVFHVPPDKYDKITATAYVPSVEDPTGYDLKYSMQQNEVWSGQLCRQSQNGECTPVEEKPKPVGYTYLGIGFFAAKSESQLSLW